MKVKNCRFNSTENFAVWQKESRRELIDLLGITELLNGERCPLNPRSLWKRENERLRKSPLIRNRAWKT